MAEIAITNPIPQFFGLDGSPLDGGYLWIGQPNQNPITSTKLVKWSVSPSVPASQPIRTINGYPARAGTPALVYVDGNFSMLVLDRQGRTVFYAANSADSSNGSYILGILTAFISDLANPAVGDALVGVQQPYTNTVARTQHQKNTDFVSVDDWGAKGDGATDDTAALTLAESIAFTRGVELAFSYGRTYCVNGGFTSRVGVIGNGSVLKNTAAGESLGTGVLHFASVTGVTVRDLTIECNSTRRGLLVLTGTRVTIENVRVNSALFGGIAVYSGNNVSVTNCQVDGVIYIAAGTGAADGFYFDSSIDVRVLNSRAANFERIGFVCEGAGVKCDNVVFTSCVSVNARNCDRSATEFNAAFWHENTNNVSYVNCYGLNISSGVGQTSGRVRGFQSAVGSSAVCQVNYVNCQITGNTANIPFGFVSAGTGQLPSVNYENCFVQKCVVGLTSIGGIDTLAIKNFKADQINSANGQGAITFDISGNVINEIIIDGIAVTNRTYTADAADINFFSVAVTTRYRLSGARFCSHIMRGAVASAIIDDSIIEYGSGTYASFSAAELRFKSGFTGFLRTGAVKRNLWEGNQMTGGTIYLDGCRIGSATATQVQQPCSGTSVNIIATGATFDYLNLLINIGGTFTHQFSNCRMLNCPATTGFYQSNALVPTKQVLMVTGCRLEGVTAADTPLRKNTNNPTFSVLTDNTFNTTNLYDFTLGVAAANNVAA